ncbi:hypothetical protein AB0L88_01410 [Saccharopolyspora shandongensis]|uniref:hypothetical protein n=1 Tax=Saccharopolyspora shandongensis TaxID=418495 RepID=UPI003422215B
MVGKRNSDGDFAATDAAYYVPKKHWSSRLAPYASEWAGFAASWPAAAGAHLWMTGTPEALPWASAGLTLLGTGVTALTWYCSRARAAIVRRFATATAGVTTAWMTAATIQGPWETPLLQLWAFGGATAAVSWSIFKALKRGGDSEGGNDSLWEKVKLSGVKTGALQVEPNKVHGPLQLPAGEIEAADVQKKADLIAGYLGLRKGAVRIAEDPEDASQAQLTIVPQDVLKNPADWSGPSHPGGSILDPIQFGVYEDTEVVRLWLPGDKSVDRNATHMQVNGMSGSGKSAFFKQVATEIVTRRDANLIVLDPSKGDQTVAFLQGSPAFLVTDVAKCKKLVRKLPGVITDRASQLGRWGYDGWVPEAFTKHGMPYLVVWVEEASKLLQSVEKFDVIAQEARSAGISLVLSQQKSTFRQMSTDVRSQLGAAVCFGVKDPEDASYSLSDETLEAGAKPHLWKNRRPGCFYMEAPGVEESRFATPARTYRSNDEQLTAAIAEHAHLAPALWASTAQALGLPEHATTTETEDRRGGAVVPLHNPAPHDADEDSLAAFEDALHDEELGEFEDDPDDEDAGLTPIPPETETDLGEVDPDAELPDLPEGLGSIPLPQPKPSLAQARANLTAWIDNQPGVFGPKDVPAELHGRDRSWASRELSAMAEQGLLTRADDPGTYRARPTRKHAA